MKEIQDIELFKLSAETNRLSEGDIERLAKNIEEYGLQFPLIVVRNKEEGFDIIDGRRRYQALRTIEENSVYVSGSKPIKTAPCIVLTKEEAKEDLSLILNTYRLELNPVELYNMAVQYVQEELKGDPLALPAERIRDVAVKLNLDIHATCRILNIGRMEEELRDAISSKKISLRLALLTLRISSKTERKRFWRRCVKDRPSINEALNYLKWDIRGMPNRNLSNAVFDTLEECIDCRYRGYHDKSLFDGISRTVENENKDFCWNISCYEKKEKTTWDKAFKEAREKLGLTHISKLTDWMDRVPFKRKKVIDLEQCKKCKQVKLGIQHQHSNKLDIYCPKTCRNIKGGMGSGQQEKAIKKDPKDFTKKEKKVVLEERFGLAARKVMIKHFFIKDSKKFLEGKEPLDYKRILFFVGCDAHTNPFRFGPYAYELEIYDEEAAKEKKKIIEDLDLKKVAERNIGNAADHLYSYDVARITPENIDGAIELLYGIKKWCKQHYFEISEKLSKRSKQFLEDVKPWMPLWRLEG